MPKCRIKAVGVLHWKELMQGKVMFCNVTVSHWVRNSTEEIKLQYTIYHKRHCILFSNNAPDSRMYFIGYCQKY